MSLFGELTKIAKKSNERAFLMNEDNPYEVKNWVKTGCYIMNAVLSNGDIYGGIPDGKRIMISGETSTAKSLYTAFLIKSYIMAHEKAYAIFFETEGSSTVDMARSVGIPDDRIIIIPVMTIEECRTQMVKLLDKIIDRIEGYNTTVTDKGELKRKRLTKAEIEKNGKCDEKFIFIIDSLGMLSTSKEIGDTAAGKDTKDMTRAQLIKAMARITSLKLSIAQVPLLIVNHVYSTMDKYSPFEISGGSGGKYMSDIILFLQKYKDKVGTDQIGVRIKTTVGKSRYMIENKVVDIMLHFKKGLYKFSSLVELAYELGVFKKEGISFLLPDGTKAKMKDVRTKASKYLNETNLDAIRDAIMDDFSFGKIDNDEIIDGDDDEIIEESIDMDTDTEEIEFDESE